VVVVFVDTLPKSPPVRKETHCDQVIRSHAENRVGHPIFLGARSRNEIRNRNEILEWLSHARDNISEKEISEPDRAKGSNQNLEDGDGELLPGNPKPTLEAGLAAEGEEEHHQDDHEPGHFMLKEVV
jgi:hypothetical protein